MEIFKNNGQINLQLRPRDPSQIVFPGTLCPIKLSVCCTGIPLNKFFCNKKRIKGNKITEPLVRDFR